MSEHTLPDLPAVPVGRRSGDLSDDRPDQRADVGTHAGSSAGPLEGSGHDLRAAVMHTRRVALARNLALGTGAYSSAFLLGHVVGSGFEHGTIPWTGYGVALGWMWARRGPALPLRLLALTVCSLVLGTSVAGPAVAVTYTAVVTTTLGVATAMVARRGRIRTLGFARESTARDLLPTLLSIPVGAAAGMAVGAPLALAVGAVYPRSEFGLLEMWLQAVTAMVTIGVPLMLFERGVLTFSVPRPVGPPSLLTGRAGHLERLAFAVVAAVLLTGALWAPQPMLTLVLFLPVWAGLRFSSAGAVLVSILLGCLVVIATLSGWGAIADVDDGSPLLAAQGTMIVAVAFGLVLGLRQQECRALAIDQELAHRRARAGEANVRALLRRLDDGVVILDLGGRIRTANPRACALLGHPESVLLGSRVTDHWIDPAAPLPSARHGVELRARISRLVDRGRTVSAETQVERSDGKVLWTSSHFVPLTGDDPAHALAIVFTDLTQQRSYERGLTTFARSVAHDLRGAIGAVGRWFDLIDMAAEDYELPVDQEARLRGLASEGTHATRELTDLLAGLLRTTTERDPEVGVVDLAGCVRRQAWLLGLADSLELGPLPAVLGRAPQLEQLVGNLLANSARYVRPGEEARVEVSARLCDAGRMVLIVRDHGPGIPEAEREDVFAPARRGSAAGGDGHGLGLAICADIARAHDGTIRACAPIDGGAGVQMEITLPLAP